MVGSKNYSRICQLLFMFMGLTGQLYAEKAVFAGGCFWCMESDFQDAEGVKSVVSGYTGGHLKNPTYKQVSRTHTGHYEAIEINYDPDIISYQQLLAIYWVNIDPFDDGGQFCDKGASYRAAIFPLSSEQRIWAENSKKARQKIFADKPVVKQIVTKIIDASVFYPAEQYHQDYYLKNPVRYKYYRWNCGRDKRLKAVWAAVKV